MEIISLCEDLLEALERFDEAVLPLGLYAVNEPEEGKRLRHQEWERALIPFLKTRGCRVSFGRSGDQTFSYMSFQNAEGENFKLSLVRYSSIKVRKYGSSYHVDKHEDRSSRWQRTDLSGHISSLWKHNDRLTEALHTEARILVFIGFDKAQRPLERELSQLQQQLKWDEKAVSHFTRNWPDKAGRGFGVRLSAWARNAIL